MLLGTLEATLLGNLFTDKNMKPKIPERGVISAGEETIWVCKGTIRAGQGF